jgi:hypothetical protein
MKREIRFLHLYDCASVPQPDEARNIQHGNDEDASEEYERRKPAVD